MNCSGVENRVRERYESNQIGSIHHTSRVHLELQQQCNIGMHTIAMCIPLLHSFLLYSIMPCSRIHRDHNPSSRLGIAHRRIHMNHTPGSHPQNYLGQSHHRIHMYHILKNTIVHSYHSSSRILVDIFFWIDQSNRLQSSHPLVNTIHRTYHSNMLMFVDIFVWKGCSIRRRFHTDHK